MNKENSRIYFFNTRALLQNAISFVLGFQVGKLLAKFLGVHIFDGECKSRN